MIAGMPKHQTKPHSPLEVIKGDVTPLSPQQRDLVAIFVEYLRHLPKWDDEHSWKSDAYRPVHLLLDSHYQREHPSWDGKLIDSLPEDDCENFRELFRRASSADAEDPRIRRRSELLELAQDKNRLVWFARHYESDRVRLGLPEEGLFPSLLLTARKEPEEPQDGCA